MSLFLISIYTCYVPRDEEHEKRREDLARRKADSMAKIVNAQQEVKAASTKLL